LEHDAVRGPGVPSQAQWCRPAADDDDRRQPLVPRDLPDGQAYRAAADDREARAPLFRVGRHDGVQCVQCAGVYVGHGRHF
jgi:hypothetical protein